MPTPDEMKKGCHGTCETVKVKSGDSYIVINKEDFDAKQHHLYEEGDKPHGKVVEATGSSQGKAKG